MKDLSTYSKTEGEGGGAWTTRIYTRTGAHIVTGTLEGLP